MSPRTLLVSLVVLLVCVSSAAANLNASPTSGDDRIEGTAARDVIDLLLGDDVADTLAGDDSIEGAPGNDRIDSGADDDMVNGFVGNDVLVGGSGNDHLGDMEGWCDKRRGEPRTDRENSNFDLFCMNDGKYLPRGEQDNDILVGGAGEDTLRASWGNDILVPHQWDDSCGKITRDSVSRKACHKRDGSANVVDCGASGSAGYRDTVYVFKGADNTFVNCIFKDGDDTKIVLS